MVQLWQFRRKYGGEIVKAEINLNSVIVTRPFVHRGKIDKYCRYEGKLKAPGVIKFGNDLQYLIDGHHRSVANYKNGVFILESDILVDFQPQLRYVLNKRDCGSVDVLARNLK